MTGLARSQSVGAVIGFIQATAASDCEHFGLDGHPHGAAAGQCVVGGQSAVDGRREGVGQGGGTRACIGAAEHARARDAEVFRTNQVAQGGTTDSNRCSAVVGLGGHGGRHGHAARRDAGGHLGLQAVVAGVRAAQAQTSQIDGRGADHIFAVKSSAADAAAQCDDIAGIHLAIVGRVGAYGYCRQQSCGAVVSGSGVAVIDLIVAGHAGDLEGLGVDDAVDATDAVTAGQLVIARVSAAQGQASQGVALACACVLVVKTATCGAHVDHIASDQACACHHVVAVVAHLSQADVQVVEAGSGVVHLAHTSVHVHRDLPLRDATSQIEGRGAQLVVTGHRSLVAGHRCQGDA